MGSFEYRVSVIVPMYNVEQFLRDCLDSLVAQSIDKKDMEVLLIDDGSSDNGLSIAFEYSERYPFIKPMPKEHGGVSAARNYGIQNAKGRYLLYLDPDDMLSPETVESVVNFFDTHETEVDLVTYRIIPIINGQRGKPHFRYSILQESGIYELSEPENAYITQTTMNICVRNLWNESTLFDTSLTVHEDQKYIAQILREKMKIGYCDRGEYLYNKQPDGAVNTHKYPYYIFEPSLHFWEELFKSFDPEPVPRYYQAMYLHDLNWKLDADVLIPYHYAEEDLKRAKARLCSLLDQVEDKTILDHPAMDEYRKSFFLSQKKRPLAISHVSPEELIVESSEGAVLTEQRAEILVKKIKVKEHLLSITAIARSPVFNYCDKPRVFLITNKDKSNAVELPLQLSALSYHRAHIITNRFWLFDVNLDIENAKSISLLVLINGAEHRCRFSFDWQTFMFETENGNCMGAAGGYEFHTDEDTLYLSQASGKVRRAQRRRFRNEIKQWLIRQFIMLPWRKKVWLYSDNQNVLKDNGYYQFDHDFRKKDGIRRFYVVNSDDFKRDRKEYPPEQQPYLVKSESYKHKILFLKSDMILTSDIARESYVPYVDKVFRYYSDICNQHEVIYLQHGVLHAHLPWLYSRELSRADREVISSHFEEENLKANYNFAEKNLIKSGMPRYDLIDQQQKSVNRILYAPSWRRYLVGRVKGRWANTDKIFLESRFYKETLRLLASPELARVLEKYDFYLDFKLHPIMKRYQHFYDIQNPRINTAEVNDVKETEYSLFVTDFSSFAFDFVYLNKPIVYFVPDDELVRSGMAQYRELDLPLDDAFGELAHTGDETVECIERILERNCRPDERFAEKMKDFFFYKDNRQRERIYKVLTEK